MPDSQGRAGFTPSPDLIALTFCDMAEIGAADLACARSFLEEHECAQASRFHFPEDRDRFLVTRALVRTVLTQATGVAERDWRFAPDAYGRPHVTGPAQDARGLTFNVSHTRRFIVVGLAQGRALGVDVEDLDRGAAIEVAHRYFAPMEVAALGRETPELQPERFFEYWTFKEAYIKARGLGLSLPLDRFGFVFPGTGEVAFTALPGLDDVAERWHFWQLRPRPRHLVAVCAGQRGPKPSLSAQLLVPGRPPRPMPVEISRESH